MTMPYKRPTTVKEVQARLATMNPDFSKGSRRIADFLMANPSVVAVLSAGEVAKRCDVHPSSLVRLAQGLGLSGFRELKAVLQNDIATTKELTASTKPAIAIHREQGDKLRLRFRPPALPPSSSSSPSKSSSFTVTTLA